MRFGSFAQYMYTPICHVGVASITQYTHVPNRNNNTQGRSPNVVKVIFPTSGSKFFPLREVPILKKGAIGEN